VEAIWLLLVGLASGVLAAWLYQRWAGYMPKASQPTGRTRIRLDVTLHCVDEASERIAAAVPPATPRP